MSARIVLVLDAAASKIEYALVDTELGRVLADGRVDGVGSTDASVRHTEHFFAQPGEPALTVLSATARTTVPIPDPSAAIRTLLDQFAQHGPSLDGCGPIAIAILSADDDLRTGATAALPGIPQLTVPDADSPLDAARRALGLI